jgi:hypothetical protein
MSEIFLPPCQNHEFTGLDEAMNYHDSNRWGYFSILAGPPGGKLKQESHNLKLLPQVLPILDPKNDTFLGQNEFKLRNRRVVNLLRICLVFVDLDLSKTELLAGKPLRDLDFLFSWHHNYDQGIFPSAIIFSGRGYHLKWFLERPIPCMALPRWNAVQNALVNKYGELGADSQSKDASRVLRVIGTTNSKSGRIASVLYPNPCDVPKCYMFEDLAKEILPYDRSEIKDWRLVRDEREKKKESGRGNFSTLLGPASLNWARMNDLRTLMNHRKSNNGNVVPKGQRDLFLFWMINFLMLSRATTPQLMYFEAAVLAKEIDPSWGYRSQELSTVYYKAIKYSQGESVEYNGKKYPALYTPRNETLVNLFGITSAEMTMMRTIISHDETKRRDKLRHEMRRRKTGGLERENYLVNVGKDVEARKAQAQALRDKGLSYREIALELGVSVASVFGYLKTT